MSIRLALAMAGAILLLVLAGGWYLTGQQLNKEHTSRVSAERSLKNEKDAAKITRAAAEDLAKRLAKIEATSAAERKAINKALSDNPNWAKTGIPKEVLNALK